MMELISDAADQIDPVNADLEVIGIPGGIGKELEDYAIEGAHVRGARYMNTMSGTDIGINSKPKRVYLQPTICLGEGEDAEMVDVISFEELSALPAEYRSDLKIDAAAMTNKLIEKPLDEILQAVGVDTKAAIKGQSQTGLAAFM
ncbi:hypothetical protein EA462_02475 [Natrarchaeobius halalkaliphilus]|uniref:DNA-directed DNA polymerase n=1 Tax=Natrarchaeobius halalkaliphilus TaxID=1679091 RepID=A0A3N6P4Z0_9EURY|nr:hypothetical protein [Natrarchaeobius halalkaliphilus]RQG93089.1 hypothetical protein EA462_02475 [Natrarchaeobius halalkaliphilus]